MEIEEKELNQKSEGKINNKIIFILIYLFVLIISLFLIGDLRVNPWMESIISFFPEKIVFYFGAFFFYIFLFPISFFSQIFVNLLSREMATIFNSILLFIYMSGLFYVFRFIKKISQKNIKYLIISVLLILIIISSYWLFFIKPLYKSQGPVNNSNSATATETVKSWKTLQDPIFNFTLKYPDDWETSVTQIVQLGSKMNRSWPTIRFQTRSKNNMSIPDGTINVDIGKTNKTLFNDSLKDLSLVNIGKGKSLLIDGQTARQINYNVAEEYPPNTTTLVYYPDDSFIQITFSSTDKDKQQKYLPIYKEILGSLHRDLTAKVMPNPFSAFVNNIKKNGVPPKQWDGATISVNIMANDLYQVIVEYNNILEENETFLSYSEYWTNNRTGNWELLGRYSSGQQGLSTCEDWEKLKVAQGMECRKLDDGATSQVKY